MATTYTFNFTDTTKTKFTVSPYTTNGTLSPSDGTLLSTSVVASTSLKLYGKGMQEYGEGIEQNLIYMLENFADDTAPVHPIEGQLWYQILGSPLDLSLVELKIFNNNSGDNDPDISTNWDNVLLSTGTSPMSGILDMGGNLIINLDDATNPTDALNLQTADNRYVNVTGDTITGNLFLSSTVGGPSTPLTPSDPSHAINKQYADDTYVNITGDTMTGALILRSSIGTGSPATIDILEAASIEYVDTQIAGATNSYLSAVTYQSFTGAIQPGLTDSEILFTVAGQPSIAIGGINFVGQSKPATEISITSTGDIPTGDAQAAINLLESKKLDIDGSDAMTGDLNLNNNFIINLSDPIGPQDASTKTYVDTAVNTIVSIPDTTRNIVLTTATDTYPVFKYGAATNKLQITLNGQVQYANSVGANNIAYDLKVDEINSTTSTTLDANTNYSFDITVDGGSPLTTQTIEINLGGPLTPISTHQELIDAINVEFFDISGLYPRMSLTNISNSETIISSTIGLGSSIIIEPPSTGTGTYLFDIPSAITVTDVTLDVGSPIPLDSFTVLGDQTASFPVGKKFTVRNTTTDGTVGTSDDNFDSVYTVNSSTAGSSPLETVIVVDENIELNGTTITGFGEIYLTNLSGLVSINQDDGADYDYAELSSLDGTDIRASYLSLTRFIKFNTTPPVGQTMEILLAP